MPFLQLFLILTLIAAIVIIRALRFNPYILLVIVIHLLSEIIQINHLKDPNLSDEKHARETSL